MAKAKFELTTEDEFRRFKRRVRQFIVLLILICLFTALTNSPFSLWQRTHAFPLWALPGMRWDHRIDGLGPRDGWQIEVLRLYSFAEQAIRTRAEKGEDWEPYSAPADVYSWSFIEASKSSDAYEQGLACVERIQNSSGWRLFQAHAAFPNGEARRWDELYYVSDEHILIFITCSF